MVTRRGTNQWHGTVYEYYLDNNWSANTFENNASGTPVPSFHYSRFGAPRRSDHPEENPRRENLLLRQLSRPPLSQYHHHQQGGLQSPICGLGFCRTRPVPLTT